MSPSLIDISRPSSTSSEARSSPLIYTRATLLALATSPLSNAPAPLDLSSFPELKRRVRRSVIDAYKALEYEVEHFRADSDGHIQARATSPQRKHKRTDSARSGYSTATPSDLSSSASSASASPRGHYTPLSSPTSSPAQLPSPDLKSKSSSPISTLTADAQASLPPVWKANIYIPPARRALGQTQPEAEQRSRNLRAARTSRRPPVWRPLASTPAGRALTVGGW